MEPRCHLSGLWTSRALGREVYLCEVGLYEAGPWEAVLSDFSNLKTLQREMDLWEVGLSGLSNLRVL